MIRNVETTKRESFARLALISLRRITNSSIRARENFPINPMKKLLIASLCSVTLALTSFGQTSPPPTTTSPAAVNPAVPATTPAAPAVPGATVTGTSPVVPPATTGVSPVTGISPAAGTTPATAISPATTTTAVSPAANASPTPAGALTVPSTEFDKNFFIHNFKAGGPI